MAELCAIRRRSVKRDLLQQKTGECPQNIFAYPPHNLL